MGLESAGKFVEAAAHFAEATENKTPGLSSRLKDKATLGHAKRLVRIAKELRKFGNAEKLGDKATRLLIANALSEAGAGDELSAVLSGGDAPKLAAAEAEIERVIDITADSAALPAVEDEDIVALVEGDVGGGSFEESIAGKVNELENRIGEIEAKPSFDRRANGNWTLRFPK